MAIGALFVGRLAYDLANTSVVDFVKGGMVGGAAARAAGETSDLLSDGVAAVSDFFHGSSAPEEFPILTRRDAARA